MRSALVKTETTRGETGTLVLRREENSDGKVGASHQQAKNVDLEINLLKTKIIF